MCGRFKAGFEFRKIKVRWQIFNDLDFTPHYNIAPTLGPFLRLDRSQWGAFADRAVSRF